MKEPTSNNTQDKERAICINTEDDNAHFKPNYIRTTKYKAYNFFFLSLIFQFKRFANIYFLIIAVLQSLPIISPLSPLTAIFPLVFVLVVSMIREGIEDISRYKSDKETNNKPVKVLLSNTSVRQNAKIESYSDKFSVLRSRDVKVGDILLINSDEPFPADLVLLGTSNDDLSAYVETSSLDGEKALKKKFTFESINKLAAKQMFMLQANIKCMAQSKALSEFNASIINQNISIAQPISEKQLLLKGAVLKNTDWITAVVVYTGVETKIMLNSQSGLNKMSRMEKMMSRLIIFVLVMQIILSIIAGVLSVEFHKRNSAHYVYISFYQSSAVVFGINFASYFLLLNTLIPISLIVTLEIVKFIQGKLISCDVMMYKNGHMPKISTCTINEEVGQVKYIFSDKTGTLTANCLELKLLHIFGKDYGDPSVLNKAIKSTNKKEKIIEGEIVYSFDEEEIQKALASCEPNIMPIYSEDKEYAIKLQNKREAVLEFLKHLSICHDCVCKNEGNKRIYQVN